MATTTVQPEVPQKEANPPLLLSKIQGHPPLVNLGKLKNKKSKKLRKGKEMPVEVHQHLQQLQSGMKGNTQPLVISYEAKPRKKRKKKNKINLMGIKIDRKKLKNRMKKSGIRF
jgi:hypothetical protein